MAGINMARVFGGGIVAGLVMNVIDAVVNGALLGARWGEETKRLGIEMTGALESQSLTGWIVYDFVGGILILWLYAAIRPRYGAGAKTAIIAGLAFWFITHMAFAAWVFNGLYSLGIVGASTLGGLVSAALGALAGCALYNEP
jgi:hypothetical protein